MTEHSIARQAGRDRLAGAGVLVIPSEMFAPADPLLHAVPDDQHLTALINAMTEEAQNAQAPTVVTAPHEVMMDAGTAVQHGHWSDRLAAAYQAVHSADGSSVDFVPRHGSSQESGV